MPADARSWIRLGVLAGTLGLGGVAAAARSRRPAPARRRVPHAARGGLELRTILTTFDAVGSHVALPLPQRLARRLRHGHRALPPGRDRAGVARAPPGLSAAALVRERRRGGARERGPRAGPDGGLLRALRARLRAGAVPRAGPRLGRAARARSGDAHPGGLERARLGRSAAPLGASIDARLRARPRARRARARPARVARARLADRRRLRRGRRRRAAPLSPRVRPGPALLPRDEARAAAARLVRRPDAARRRPRGGLDLDRAPPRWRRLDLARATRERPARGRRAPRAASSCSRHAPARPRHAWARYVLERAAVLAALASRPVP